MVTYSERALLPEGLHDDLPPDSEYEASVIERLLARFAAYGYDRVSPPLVEFEESLLAGPGATQSRQMFRLMDPISQRMMGVRTDITFQVARIATTRLAASERPLRLSYAGDVLRVKGSQMRAERQFGQAGVELIGSSSLEADVEVLLLAAEALWEVGVRNLSIDLTLPHLVPAVCRGLGLDEAAIQVARDALNDKDIGELKAIEGPAGQLLRGLLAAAGPADEALADMRRLELPPEAALLRDELEALVARMRVVAPDLTLTIDPGEYQGFEYKSGIGFSLFAKGVRGELGRGGRYMVNGDKIQNANPSKASGETAVGFSVYLDSLMRAVPTAPTMPRLYVSVDTPIAQLKKLHEEGWRTIRGLNADADSVSEARRLKCSLIYKNGRVTAFD
jgi:ATP phosphoribosyltransferase regulatory subunit